ncbi:DUF488 domain-containing protein [Nocardiopsis baichengensis]|uniref:DUF488 domain-containing protein n=1 Tax=Nocardiopsis baichengensis TaxID=280240 RepID=UPI00034A0241|nr:DUF488 family protein [Nocardiopsis baichengensis]WNB50066.1 DUF488 family protein [Nocardiopsis baichengensis]
MGDDIRLMRVYDAEGDGAPAEGRVFLVDRLWPRGVRKEALHLDGWLKDAAPSPGLRTWFGHDPDRWREFSARYERELEERPDAVDPILRALDEGPVTLLYAAKDTEHTHALVLRDHVRARRRREGTG